MFFALVTALLSGSPAAVIQPPIRVWLTSDSDVMYFRPGDPVRVLFQSADDANVVVLRSDASGRITVLFPADPEDMNLVRGETTYEVLGRGQPRAFIADDNTGTGMVLAARTNRSVPVGRFARKDSAGGWDYPAIDAARNGRSGRDGLIEIAKALAVDGQLDYDIATYVVSSQPPPVAQSNPPPLEGERAPLPGTYNPEPYQEPYPVSQQLLYDPFGYAYPMFYDGAYLYNGAYLPADRRGSRHHHHGGFVPCQIFCYPGSPTALVDFAHVPAGGNTGTGLFIGRGDPASYLAVPWGPRPQVPQRVPQVNTAGMASRAAQPAAAPQSARSPVASARTVTPRQPGTNTTLVVIAPRRPATPVTVVRGSPAPVQPARPDHAIIAIQPAENRVVVATSNGPAAARSARPLSAAENRNLAKITFGPVAPLRARRDAPPRQVVGATALSVRPGRNQAAVPPAAVAAQASMAAQTLTPQAARVTVPQAAPAQTEIMPVPRMGLRTADQAPRQTAPVAAGSAIGARATPAPGPASAPRPAIGGRAYVGPPAPTVPRTIPHR